MSEWRFLHVVLIIHTPIEPRLDFSFQSSRISALQRRQRVLGVEGRLHCSTFSQDLLLKWLFSSFQRSAIVLWVDFSNKSLGAAMNSTFRSIIIQFSPSRKKTSNNSSCQLISYQNIYHTNKDKLNPLMVSLHECLSASYSYNLGANIGYGSLFF